MKIFVYSVCIAYLVLCLCLSFPRCELDVGVVTLLLCLLKEAHTGHEQYIHAVFIHTHTPPLVFQQ